MQVGHTMSSHFINTAISGATDPSDATGDDEELLLPSFILRRSYNANSGRHPPKWASQQHTPPFCFRHFLNAAVAPLHPSVTGGAMVLLL